MQSETHNVPDSLQDLCIFYCVEHPECFCLSSDRAWEATQLSNAGGGDAVTTPDHGLPVAVCDKLVAQFLKTFIPLLPINNAVLGTLLKHKNICSKLNLVRADILSDTNLCDIACNHITSLNLYGCMEYSFENKGIEKLIRHNKANIKNMRVYGVFADLEDSDSPYYSFLSDPRISSVMETHSSSKPVLLDKVKVYIRGDFSANQRFTVKSQKSQTLSKEVTLLHLDGCYRQTKERYEVDWFHFPNLQSFTVIDTDATSNVPSDLIIWNILVSNPQLTALCVVSIDVSSWWSKVSKLENLTSLVLSSSFPRQQGRPTSFFQHLKGLNNLRHLDVSSAAERNYTDEEVEEFLNYVHSSPKLVSLELAGTNLSMIIGHELQCRKNTDFNPAHCTENCMAPLGNRRFEYLGLLNCPHSVTRHKYIPANKVSGTNGGKQILSAIWSYQHNLGLMSSLLDIDGILTQTDQEDSPVFPGAYIEAILTFLDQYPDWKCVGLQQPILKVTGKVLYNLYKIMTSSIKRGNITVMQKRRLLERMLVLLSNCLRDIADGYPGQDVTDGYPDYVSRLALVNLICLPLPDVAAYCYMMDKYLKMIILVVQRRPKPMIMHLALRLIHAACRYTQELKARIGGEFGLTKVLLKLISDNKEITASELEGNCTMENVIEKAWSVIWTLTDEVPSNCERFVEFNGLEISRETIELNPENSFELHRKITGALSNVAENSQLRPALCREDLVRMMRDMLKTQPGGIDVSSHAAAFLVLLAADGPEAWTVEDPSREAVLKDVETTIDKWQLDSSRGVKFRSLNPMTQQLENKDCPVAQYWASWMICNLITIKPSRYCVMFREEGGLEILDRLRIRPDLLFKVRNLLSKMADIMEQNKDTVMGDEDY